MRTTMSLSLGLRVRMLATLLLLSLLYLAFVLVLLAAGVGTTVLLVVVAGLALAQLFLSVVLVAGAVYLLSSFLMLALSRYREFAADRGAALTTGRPSALAVALRRIAGEMDRVPARDLRAVGQMGDR